MLGTLDKAIWLDRYVRMYINMYIYIYIDYILTDLTC